METGRWMNPSSSESAPLEEEAPPCGGRTCAPGLDRAASRQKAHTLRSWPPPGKRSRIDSQRRFQEDHEVELSALGNEESSDFDAHQVLDKMPKSDTASC